MPIKNIVDKISPLWGICPFEELSDSLIKCRAAERLPKRAKSVIVACFPYLMGKEDYADINVSKYAAVADYHDVALNRLEKACSALSEAYPGGSFVPFADNSPIPEIKAASLAGLGVKGMNSLLITEKYGSYVFIGEIVTDIDFKIKSKDEKSCIKCGACLKACPSGALTAEGLDKELCLSAVTQRKGELTEREKQLMIECGCVWGCDICQDVCPMNKNACQTDIEEFLSSCIPHVSLGCEPGGRAYEWRGRKVIERNIAILEE